MRTLRRQRGASLVSQLLAVPVGSAMALASIQGAQALQTEVAMSQYQTFAINTLPTILPSIYYGANRRYDLGIRGNDPDSWTDSFRQRSGLGPEQTNGDTWVVSDVQPSRLRVVLSMSSMRDPAAAARNLSSNVSAFDLDILKEPGSNFPAVFVRTTPAGSLDCSASVPCVEVAYRRP